MKKKTIKEQLAKLIDVKSIWSIIVMIVFCVLALLGRVDAKDFMIVVMAIITFYFAKPDKKTSDGGKEDDT